jgi:hypothetical protein
MKNCGLPTWCALRSVTPACRSVLARVSYPVERNQRHHVRAGSDFGSALSKALRRGSRLIGLPTNPKGLGAVHEAQGGRPWREAK